jgi:hypothetical protein
MCSAQRRNNLDTEQFCECTREGECEFCDIGDCQSCEYCIVGQEFAALENEIWNYEREDDLGL